MHWPQVVRKAERRGQTPAGAPILYAPDGLARIRSPDRADGTGPRHLSFFASVRKPWSADISGSTPEPVTCTGRRARNGPLQRRA